MNNKIKKCDTCDGSGEVVCFNCEFEVNENGEDVCIYCNSTGKKICKDCNGGGEING